MGYCFRRNDDEASLRMQSGRVKRGGSGLFQPVRLVENVHYVPDAAMFALGLEAHLQLEHAARVSCDHFCYE